MESNGIGLVKELVGQDVSNSIAVAIEEGEKDNYAES